MRSDYCRCDHLLRYRLFAEDLIETQTDLAETEQRETAFVLAAHVVQDTARWKWKFSNKAKRKLKKRKKKK